MTTDELILALYPNPSDRTLTPEQTAIVKHPQGPAWVLAGPGSGKTEILTVLVLRLLYVENDPGIQVDRVAPDSIFVTTFTEKAARNLEDRIAGMRLRLLSKHPGVDTVDISKLRIGTLHGLCNDLLQEFRSSNYQNVRLMDTFEQALFVREHLSLIKQPDPVTEIPFWGQFPYLFTPQQCQPGRTYAPNRWNATKALVRLLNRIVEDRVSVSGLRASGNPQLVHLADLYEEYVKHLENNFRCDFSELQGRFLEFLGTPLGEAFRNGDGTPGKPGIKWVLVDEYQDTNPMQEEVYFKLAGLAPHNLVVVGDDDQAMYRFRGGSVECMVTFDAACESYLGIQGTSVARYPLVGNFRSHRDIVEFFNEYIASFPVMSQPGARAPKPPIIACKTITEAYPVVGTIEGRNLEDVAARFANMVRGLIDRKVVNDPNECCLLLKSTKESPLNAGKYVDELQRVGLRVYNPRNKSFTEQEEVEGMLGTLLAIVDPDRRYASDPANRNVIPAAVADLQATYDRLSVEHLALKEYVTKAVDSLKSHAGAPLTTGLQELLFYILSIEPFSTWQADPVRRSRMAKISSLLEAYASLPVMDATTGLPKPNVTRGFLRASQHFPGEIISGWLGQFYNLFIAYIMQSGFDDEEDDEVICPVGMVPVMTMHQSKGLEFPFVFVGHMGEKAQVQASHELETLFSDYPANSARTFTRPPELERAEMDLIRQYYVAYSRAKYALILMGTAAHLDGDSIPSGPTRRWLRHRSDPLSTI
jgi:DNA helicase-2/ATP-dependent DNA helicase PcrA